MIPKNIYDLAVKQREHIVKTCPDDDDELVQLFMQTCLLLMLPNSTAAHMAACATYASIIISRYEAENPVDQRNVEIPVTA